VAEFRYRLVNWTKVCNPISGGLGGSKFACIQLGYFREVALALMRERPFGGWLWTLNMAVLWEGGVPMRSMGCTGWGFKKVS
jgi:hypothetical protein